MSMRTAGEATDGGLLLYDPRHPVEETWMPIAPALFRRSSFLEGGLFRDLAHGADGWLERGETTRFIERTPHDFAG